MKILTIGLALFGLWVLLRRALARPSADRAEDPAKRSRITAQDLEACPRCGAFKDPREDCRACLDRPSKRDQAPPSGRA